MYALTGNRRKIGIVAAAFGGVLIMIGIVMMGIFTLACFGFLDIMMVMESQFRAMFILTLLIIGACDLIAGIILSLR